MASIGPTLPPHLLSKRKRNDDDDGDDSSGASGGSDSDGGRKKRAIGPSIPSTSVHETNPRAGLGPQTPTKHQSNGPQFKDDTGSIPSHEFPAERPRRSLGPSMPPANLLERPSDPPDTDDDSDDDFGPALPGSAPVQLQAHKEESPTTPAVKQTQAKPSRDDWMLAPPMSGARSSTIDPSKMKNRGFSSGPRAAAQPTGDMSLWTETPEEKRKRLEEEMLGIRRNDQPKANDGEQLRAEAKAAELAKKVQAYNNKNRAAPLYSTKDREIDDDDPSKRAFDREKDIGGGKLSHTETKQMLNKATDFGSRFSKGNYL